MIKTYLTAKQATGHEFVREQRYRLSPPVYAHVAVICRFRADSLVVFGFGVCEDVRLQVS